MLHGEGKRWLVLRAVDDPAVARLRKAVPEFEPRFEWLLRDGGLETHVAALRAVLPELKGPRAADLLMECHGT